MTKKKTTFTLKNIDPVQVVKKYNGDETRDNTSISDLLVPKQQSTRTDFSFIDETRKYVVDMKDSITHKRILSKTCFWCRHAFENEPLGCPIRYQPRQHTKICHSEITKEEYIIRQSIPKYIAQPEDTEAYYETEGSFCSLNCVLAYIYDKGNDSYYENSESLLMNIYMEMYPQTSEKLLPAPSWKLLNVYGGTLTIEQFRLESIHHSFNIQSHYIINSIPKMVPLASVYEQIFIY